MTKVKHIIKAITTRLSFLPSLPGQGVFGSEKSDDMDFTVTLYKSEIERARSKSDMENAAEEVIEEYLDCIHNQYTMSLEKTKNTVSGFRTVEPEKLYDAISGRSDIVASENVGKMIMTSKRFRPTRRKSEGRIRYIGTLDKAKVYVNSYVCRGEVYVIDRSVIDIRYDVKPGQERIEVNIKTRVNNEGVTKYLLTV